MNKEELYYLVNDGTNEKVLLRDNTPLICDAVAAGKEIDKWHHNKVMISIKDFEDLYFIDAE